MRGDNVNAQDNFGETALHYAAAKGDFKMAEILLSHGADSAVINTASQTPFGCAKQGRVGRGRSVERFLGKIPLKDLCVSVPGGKVVDTFWIDSVCINQNDVAERNDQVALMATIFTSAVAVRIWLGGADKETEMNLLAASVDEEVERQRRGLMPYSPYRGPSVVHTEIEMERRSWFDRRWVVQECCLSQTHEIYCGDLELNLWKTANPNVAFYESRFSLLPPSNKLINLKRFFAGNRRDKNLFIYSPKQTPPIPPLLHLSDLVERTWGLKS